MDPSTTTVAAVLVANLALGPLFLALERPSSKHAFSVAASLMTFRLLFGLASCVQLLLLTIATFHLTKAFGSHRFGPALILVLLMGVLGLK